MAATVQGFSVKHPEVSTLGERVSAWLRRHGFTANPLAARARLDKRDAQRVLEGSIGPRAFDKLASAFGWPFIEAVMTPVVGADPLTALENEIARERAEIEARESRLAHVRSAARARNAVASGGLRLVAEEDRTWTASDRRKHRNVGEGEDR